MTRYTKDTTADEVLVELDLSARRFVITGASSGLGEESARALAARGASITMLARSQPKLDAAAQRILERVPDANLELGIVDVSDLSSIRRFVAGFLDDHDAIDVLINNAGIMGGPLERTPDGFEMQFGTNHLGPFYLTGLLGPALLAGNEPRVVTISSSGHTMGNIDLIDPNYTNHDTYNPWEAYGRSKTANALFARELARRLGGRGLQAFSVHPGGVGTKMVGNLSRELRVQLMQQLMQRVRAGPSPDERIDPKSLEAGAATQVWAATSSALTDHNGAYLADCRVAELGANLLSYGMEPWILDDDAASQLWILSEQLVGESFFA